MSVADVVERLYGVDLAAVIHAEKNEWFWGDRVEFVPLSDHLATVVLAALEGHAIVDGEIRVLEPEYVARLREAHRLVDPS